MELNKFDIVMLVTMTLAIILMSFVFPELGATDDSDVVTESQIPEYNTTNDTFEFAGAIPNTGVNSPTSGTMDFDETRDGSGSVEGFSLYWIDRPKNTGTSIQLANTSGSLTILFRDWNDTGSVIAADDYVVSEEGETIIHNNASWTIEFEVQSIENPQEPNMTAEVDFLIRDTPDGAGGGFNFDGLGDIAQVFTYVAVVITWLVVTIIEFSLNLVVIMFEISVFAIDLFHFMTSTYFAVVSGAEGWASVFLLIPGIILSLELGKLGMILISLLPTT